jgi:hypothetical protein
MAKAIRSWSPEGFERYRECYPRTPALDPRPHPDWTARFIEAWRRGISFVEHSLRRQAATTTVILVRGYLGSYMPGNLVAPCTALRALGFDAWIADNSPGGLVSGNVAVITRQIRSRQTRERLTFCGHSRGGFECLSLLAQEASIAARCAGVVLSQTPHGPSPVLESILEGRHREPSVKLRRRVVDSLERAALNLLRARAGGRELTSVAWPSLVAGVDGLDWPFPILQTASWSERPTAWLDSFHERLGEIRPGRAHDGQFYLEDLIWPGLPHVLLPQVDHAQPALGGYGFDSARYWMTALSLVLGRDAGSQAWSA